MAVTRSSEFGLRLTNFCDSMDKELVSRCIKVFRFEAHPRRKILLIVGEITITILVPADGTVEKKWTEEFKKPIHLLGINRSSKTEKLLADVMMNCPFIDNCFVKKLSDALEEIKQREYSHHGIVIHRQIAADGSYLPRYPEIFDEMAESPYCIKEEEPDFSKLDHYIELMYEDIPQKIEASIYLVELIKRNIYLYDIARHESAVNALFRTLREDCKKSTELTKNILFICLAFAKIKEFQIVLIKHKIPQLTLDIIDFELERNEKWKAQLIALKESAEKNVLQNRSVNSRAENEYRAMWMRLDELTIAQNSLLKVGFEILHCVSESKSVRENLLRQNVITSLTDSLDREDNELLEVVLSYLRSLSCFKQSIEQMVAVEIVDKLSIFLKGSIPKKVVKMSLHLLYNLSFHFVLRQRIIQCKLIKILANCFETFQDIVGKTLYVLSMVPSAREKLAKSQIVKTLMNYAVYNPDDPILIVVGSLCVNLSRNKRCAELMWESNQLGQLVKNTLRNQDIIGMKIVRNLAELEVAFLLYECVGDIATSIVGSTCQQFVTECIGTLACFDTSQVDIEAMTQKGRIFPWLKQTLGYYMEEIDRAHSESLADLPFLLTDVILLIGNLCTNEDGARHIVGEGFADLLLQILHREHQDSKITPQILNVFKICSKHESISVFFALKTRVPTGLLEFAGIAQGSIKQLCLSTLEQIGRYDDGWKENMLQFHFIAWNQDWINNLTMEEAEENKKQTLGMAEDSCHQIRHRKSTIRANGLTDDSSSSSETEQSRLSTSGNESEYVVDSNVLDLFKQQYEEEMALKGFLNDDFLNEGDQFNYESDSDSGWECVG